MLHVLVVEPDIAFARSLIGQLPAEARVTHVTTRDRALAALQHGHDVVVLAVAGAELDGVSLCRAIREISALPVLLLATSSARCLDGLAAGADDHLVRPFSTRELWARIETHVRRARGELGPGLATIAIGPLEIDRLALRARLRGEPLPLTSDELTLLRVLAERRGQVMSREQLLDLVKGSADEAFDRAIDVRVSRLRRKLGGDGALIHTVRGVGYALVA